MKVRLLVVKILFPFRRCQFFGGWRSGDGVIHSPGRFEEVFYPYYILEAPEKFRWHDN